MHIPTAVRTVRSSSIIEGDFQRNRTDLQLPSWRQQQREMQPLCVERLPGIKKLPPMPPLPAPERPKQQEGSILSKLAKLLFWWRSDDAEDTQAKPKHAKTSPRERKSVDKLSPKEKKRKMKGKSPSPKMKKSQGKGDTARIEESSLPAHEGGVKVHELAKKFAAGSGSSSSQVVAKEASSNLQKGSVASAVQKLEQNIKEKQGINMTDYEEVSGGEEWGEDDELHESEDEKEENFDKNKELKVRHLILKKTPFRAMY